MSQIVHYTMILSLTHRQRFAMRNKLATFLHSLIDHRNDVTKCSKCSKYCDDTKCWNLVVPNDHHSIVQNDVQHYTGKKLFTDFWMTIMYFLCLTFCTFMLLFNHKSHLVENVMLMTTCRFHIPGLCYSENKKLFQKETGLFPEGK